MARAKKSPSVPSVIFRPDSRDGRKDYLIPRDVAERLFQEGHIWGDATNGGYMPNPNSRYDVSKHKLPRQKGYL